MRRLLAALDGFWYAPMPALRLAALRVLLLGFAWFYLIARFFDFSSVARFHAAEFAPVAPVAWLNAPLSANALLAVMLLALLAGAAAATGWFYRFSAPLFGFLFLELTSYRNSWGMQFHTENLLTLHVLVLCAAPGAADAFSFDALRREPNAELSGRYGWPVRLLCLVTAACYVLAGVAKLKIAGGDWLHGDFLRSQIAFDNLRKIELGSDYSPFVAEIVRQAWAFSALAFITLLVELGAPLALLGQRWAWPWIALAWGFHVAILLSMAIVFPYQLSLIAYASFFEVERGACALAALAQRFGQRWLSTKRS